MQLSDAPALISGSLTWTLPSKITVKMSQMSNTGKELDRSAPFKLTHSGSSLAFCLFDSFGPLLDNPHTLGSHRKLSRLSDAKVLRSISARYVRPAFGATYNNFGN